MSYTDVGEGAHLGWTCSDCLRVNQDGLDPETVERRTAEQMRVYLETGPDTVDWRQGYANELKRRRRSLPGPRADELVRASRYIVREMGNLWPETPLGAAEKNGLPLVLHEGLGRSPTYELVARCAGKRMLGFFERYPEAFERAPLTFQNGQQREDTLNAFIREVEPQLWQRTATSKHGLGWTGFQYGWAVNAVRFIHDRGPVQNPAFMYLVGEDDGPHPMEGMEGVYEHNGLTMIVDEPHKND